MTKNTDKKQTETGGYYASAQDAGKHWLLAGPFGTHDQALAVVDRANRMASDLDGRMHFAAYGTCRVSPPTKLGLLNARLELTEADGLDTSEITLRKRQAQY